MSDYFVLFKVYSNYDGLFIGLKVNTSCGTTISWMVDNERITDRKVYALTDSGHWYQPALKALSMKTTASTYSKNIINFI